MSMYDQRKRNELLRDVRDSEAGKHKDSLYDYIMSIPVMLLAAAVMIFACVEAFTPW